MQGMTLLPPRPDVCQQCAVDHASEYPHNQQSLFWQYWFFGQHGRWPAWLDAMDHCTEEMQQQWINALNDRGIDVEEGETR